MAVCGARAGSGTLDLELHAVLCVDQPLPVAVHSGVGHGPQVDPEAELVAGKTLGQGHVGPSARALVRVPLRVKVTREFLPHVAAAHALVVDAVGHAVHRNLHLGDVGVEEVLSVPGPGREGLMNSSRMPLSDRRWGFTRKFSLVFDPRVMGTTRSRMMRSYANSLPL